MGGSWIENDGKWRADGATEEIDPRVDLQEDWNGQWGMNKEAEEIWKGFRKVVECLCIRDS